MDYQDFIELMEDGWDAFLYRNSWTCPRTHTTMFYGERCALCGTKRIQ